MITNQKQVRNTLDKEASWIMNAFDGLLKFSSQK